MANRGLRPICILADLAQLSSPVVYMALARHTSATEAKMDERCQPSERPDHIPILTQVAELLAVFQISMPSMPEERLRAHAKSLAAPVIRNAADMSRLSCSDGAAQCLAADRFVEEHWTFLLAMSRDLVALSFNS